MERKKGLWVGVLLFCVVSFLNAQGQVATISPAKPKIGDTVILTYNVEAKGATLGKSADVSAEVLLAKKSGNPELLELPMKKQGKLWKASFALTDAQSVVLLLRFTAGENKDDNGENSWLSMVYGANGNPVEGAHSTRGSMLRSGRFVDFLVEKDVAAATAALTKERELYPGNYTPLFIQWSMKMREKPGDETKAEIQKELVAEFGKGKVKEEDVAQFAAWFEQVGMKEKADEIRNDAVTANPKGKVAQAIALNNLSRERDGLKRAEALEKFLADFPQQGADKDSYERTLAYARANGYSAAGQYDEALAALEGMPVKDGSLYNSIAWPLIEKGTGLEKGVAIAKRGVELLRKPDPSSKPGYLSRAQWKKSNETNLGMVLDTYGFGLSQLGKTAEAESAYEEAFGLTKGDQADINQRLVDCYVKNGKWDKAIKVATDCIAKGKSNHAMVDSYKAAYAKVNGSEDGFEAALARVKQSAKTDMKKDLVKSRVNKPAVDFALKDLKGKVVKLSDLKGKVVVVDFWATWCGPCKASFPYLQKVYEQYKSNPKVVILALNTWENVAGKEREDLVKKFMADNKYTFPVLYDEGFVEKFGVSGIPTKFIIDKKGMIQFKSVGFLGGDKMIEEMTMQLDMLLDDNFYTSRD